MRRERRCITGALTVAASLLVCGMLSASVGGADARGATAFVVALPVPDAGDLTYGIARVRIVPGRRLPSPAGQAEGQRAYAGLLGGLRIVARSSAWHALRGGTRIYLVASRVAGADASEREVAFFIVRRHLRGARSAPRAAQITFSTANAIAVTGCFWVRGLDGRGRARVFVVRNMLATAAANWSRYLSALRAAHALHAALHPLAAVLRSRTDPRHPAAVDVRPVLWTGGMRASRRVRAIFRLLTDALGNPDEYAAAKRNPLIAEFIARELNNPALVRLWRRITAALPLRVPDRYAAAAQEEARFSPVKAPRISRASVAIADQTNSSSQMSSDNPVSATTLKVQLQGPGSGVVKGREWVYGPNLDCGMVCQATFANGATTESLTAIPAGGSALSRWSGCDTIRAGACIVQVGTDDRTVTASFTLANSLRVTLLGPGQGNGHITSDPDGIDCGIGMDKCLAVFKPGQEVTLTEEHFGRDGYFAGWFGCTPEISIPSPLNETEKCSIRIPAGGAEVTATFNVVMNGGPVLNRIAGNGHACPGPPGGCGDGGSATDAQLNLPGAVALDPSGSLIIADTEDFEIRKLARDGTITRIAGTGQPCATATCGDGGPATSAQLSSPSGVAVDTAGNIYIADRYDNEIRKIDAEGMISRFAGNGNFCAHPPDCGDLGPATSAQLTAPAGVAVDAADDVFIADTGDNEIRVVEPNGLIGRLAGDGTPCGDPSHCSDGQFATTAQLRAPMGVAVASDGTVYIADTGDNEVRAVRLGDIFRWAGNGKHCRTAPGCGDDDYAPFAELSAPTGVAVDRSGDVYIADSDDGEVRKVQVSDEITRIAGAGTRCGDAPTCGDGGDAKQAELSFPAGIAVDSAENVYIADTQDHEIRKLG